MIDCDVFIGSQHLLDDEMSIYGRFFETKINVLDVE